MEHFDYEGSDLSSDIGFLTNTGRGFLENHKTTKPAYNVRPLSARLTLAALAAMFLTYQMTTTSNVL